MFQKFPPAGETKQNDNGMKKSADAMNAKAPTIINRENDLGD
jgi:hypothetical protein